ncbi:MAG: signal recognition particle-docking protein FtsY [Candidatus Nanoarchaeia archaeon]
MFEFFKKAIQKFTEQLSKSKEKKEGKEALEKKEEKVALEAEKKEKVVQGEKVLQVEKKEKKEKGFLDRALSVLTETKVSEKDFESIFGFLEIELIQNNVAWPIICELRQNLEKAIVGKTFQKSKLEEKIREIFKQTIYEILSKPKQIDLIELAKKKKEKQEALILLILGVNGHGKTLTIAKLANLFLKENLRPIFAASDTFRAAAIEQLAEHAKKLNVRLVSHKYGADPAAVAFDAIKAKDKDVVLIDTAGRQSLDANLMAELAKIKRVAKPDLTIFVGEAIAGSDLVAQAKQFDEQIGFDAIILTKLDVDDKGGAMLSIAQATGKPILYVGTGQEYSDLMPFNAKEIVEKMFG